VQGQKNLCFCRHGTQSASHSLSRPNKYFSHTVTTVGLVGAFTVGDISVPGVTI